jgi:hypothetical protein
VIRAITPVQYAAPHWTRANAHAGSVFRVMKKLLATTIQLSGLTEMKSETKKGVTNGGDKKGNGTETT